MMRTNRTKRRDLSSVSMIALMAAQAMAMAAAQEETDDTPETEDVIIVRGIARSLESAQELKREGDTFLDAITAEDIGALPDRSVAETLQRVPGVAITRFEGVSDPDHFSVEGSGAVIRGLTFVRSELNGRDVFSADNGQGIGFNDVAPELLGSVEVFKNQSADLIEGGIAGSVNLNVRKPFDQSGRVVAFTVEGSYSDLAEAWTPGLSGVFSDRWVGDFGEIGVLVGGSYSELESRADSSLIAQYADTSEDGTVNLVPRGGGIRTQNFDRQRDSFAFATQWRNPDRSVEATFEIFNAHYDNSWTENALEPSIDDGPSISPRPGTTFEFDDDGVFESGVISSNAGWRGNAPYNYPINGVRQLALARGRVDESTTTDYGFNLRWSASERLRTNFDIQYVESEVEVTDITVHAATLADILIDTSNEGVPGIAYLAPVADGGFTPTDDYFQNGDNYYLRSAMDHLQENEAEELAIRADAEYDIDPDGWIRSVRFGGRYAERDQIIRASTFNWGNISEIWNGAGAPRLSDSSIYDQSVFATYVFADYQLDPAENLGQVANGALFYAGPLASDYGAFVDTMTGIRDGVEAQVGGSGRWVPLGARAGVVSGTPFLPSEITDVTQETLAAYIRLDFGSDDLNGTGMTLDGNVGLRWVRTETASEGAFSYIDGAQILGTQTIEEYCTPSVPMGGGTPSVTDVQGVCRDDFVLADLLAGGTGFPNGFTNAEAFFAFADGSSGPVSAEHEYDNLLPSLNVRLGVADGQFIRFAYSRAISRPDFGLARTNFAIEDGGTDSLTGAYLGPIVRTGNVGLDPILADQFDLSYEWYFSDVGSLTITGFYKNLQDYITPVVATVGTIGLPEELASLETNNGATIPIDFESNGNADEDAQISGFELAYQQVYDFLPAPFDGFGVQANYTYVSSDGVPIIAPKNDEPSGVLLPAAGPDTIGQLGVPLLSEHTTNL
ncbi:MAG: TonB-dependent receptor, partial [Parvularcula sp.]|nr:TonB-dependent receptor [Parvularcula sp.]